MFTLITGPVLRYFFEFQRHILYTPEQRIVAPLPNMAGALELVAPAAATALTTIVVPVARMTKDATEVAIDKKLDTDIAEASRRAANGNPEIVVVLPVPMVFTDRSKLTNTVFPIFVYRPERKV